MTRSQMVLALLLLSGIAILLFAPLAARAITGNILLTMLWVIFMILFTALLLHYAIFFMKSGKMVLLSSFGNIYGLFSPQIPGKNGTFNSGILVTVPFITQRQLLPTGAFLVSLESNTANTKNTLKDPTAAVRVYAHIQVQLKQDASTLARLIHLLPGAGTHQNFTKNVDEKRYITEGADLLPKFTLEPCPCLATFLRSLLQTPFDEAVGQAIAQFTLGQNLSNVEKIQTLILARLNEEETVFKEQRVKECFSVFDINLVAIAPTNAETVSAIAARSIAVRKGHATVAEAKAKGEASIITETARATGIAKVAETINQNPGARSVLAADTLKTVNNLNVVTGTDPLTAAANLIIAKEGSNTSQPPSPPPADNKT